MRHAFNEKMIPKLLLLVVLMAALGIGFTIGRAAGVRAEQLNQVQRTTYLDAMNALARYQFFSELSQDISAKRGKKAQCTSDLMASANLNSVRTCLANEKCRELIDTEARKMAPELFTPDSKLPFRYYTERESCNTAN